MGSRVHHSRVAVHVHCVEDTLDLWGHVVIVCRARFHHADAIPRVEFFPSGFGGPLVHS